MRTYRTQEEAVTSLRDGELVAIGYGTDRERYLVADAGTITDLLSDTLGYDIARIVVEHASAGTCVVEGV
jgi:hypothetical protein